MLTSLLSSATVGSALLAVPPLFSCASPGGDVVDELDPRVWCLYQRENGEMWFGTNGAGVFRLEEDRLIQYTQEHGLTGDQVRSVVSDGAGGLLVTANGGVARFDGESFVPLEVVEHTGVDGWELGANDVWFALSIGSPRVSRFDGEKLHQLELPESAADGPRRAGSESLGDDPTGVYRVSRDRRGHVWIGTASAGLCRFDGDSIDWMYEERLTTTPWGGEFGIRSIFQDQSGDYWICNTRQRFEVEPADREGRLVYTTKEGLPDAAADDGANFTYFYSVAQDEEGALWMPCGTDGVLRYADGAVTRYSLGEDALALSILIDRAGVIWVGTLEQGLFRFDGKAFERFDPKSLGR